MDADIENLEQKDELIRHVRESERDFILARYT